MFLFIIVICLSAATTRIELLNDEQDISCVLRISRAG